MHADHCHQHHQDDQGGADGSEETYCRQSTPAELAETSCKCEQDTRSEAETIEERAGSPEAVPTKPSKEFLRRVAAQREPEDKPCDQQARIH